MNNQKLFDVPFTILVIIVSLLGSVIGMQLISTLGVTPNTSIIGALIAIILSKIPMSFFYSLKSLHAQNTVQTAISAATFGAANSLFIPLGIPYVMGRPDLMMPMLIGVAIALIIDGFMIYRVFDSKVFPATGTWPPGIAAAETIKAGDKGGKQAGILGIGIALGAGGSWLGIPMTAAGIAFIANIFAMIAFGTGLIVSGYSLDWFGADFNEIYVAHGIMIGAGLIALVQFILIMVKDNKQQPKETDDEQTEDEVFTRSPGEVGKSFGFGYIAYILGAIVLASLGGLFAELSIGMFILFVLFAAFTALVTEIIVGVAAMHSGWFPAFAVSLISLVIGMLLGFPPVALALLVGYTAATGPAFADLGYDLKAGFIVRGQQKSEMELLGRKQQWKATLIGFVIAIIMVSFFHMTYFDLDLIPPIDFVYVSTIEAGISGSVALQLAIWAIPGAIIQLIGGPKKQLGILFATGCLVADPATGFTVLAGVILRYFILKWKGEEIRSSLYTMAAGFIAGGALQGFFSNMFSLRR